MRLALPPLAWLSGRCSLMILVKLHVLRLTSIKRVTGACCTRHCSVALLVDQADVGVVRTWTGTRTSPRSSSGVLLRSELPLEWAVTHVNPSVVGIAVVGLAVQPVDDAVGDVGDRADDVQVDVTSRARAVSTY